MARTVIFFLLVHSQVLLATSTWYEKKLEGWYYFEEVEGQQNESLSPEEADDLIRDEKKKLAPAALFSHFASFS